MPYHDPFPHQVEERLTTLRDLVRQISDGNRWVEGRNVGVVDERSEIAACYRGIHRMIWVFGRMCWMLRQTYGYANDAEVHDTGDSGGG